MMLLILLIAAVTQTIAEFYGEIVPEDYLNYHRHEDLNTNPENRDADVQIDEILSLLHNENSNRALLEHISTPQDIKDTENENDNCTEKVIPKKIGTSILEFDDNTRMAINDWKRLRREEEKFTIKDKLSNSFNVIPKLSSGDSNRLKRDSYKKSEIITGKDGQDYKDTNDILSKNVDKSNKKAIIGKTSMKYSKNVRSKRETALKMLRNLFHHTSNPVPNDKAALPQYQRQSQEVSNSVNGLIANLTDTIKELNKNIANLKLNANENIGYVMIKVPISESQGKQLIQYMKNNVKNETIDKIDKVRVKRDAAILVDTNNETTLIDHLNDTINFNDTKIDDIMVDPKKDIVPTIITDSKLVTTPDGINKSKRDANTTETESNVSKSDTVENSTELPKTDLIRQTRRLDLDETDNRKDTESEDDKTEKARRFFGSRNDLLFFIEKVRREIKNTIKPMNDIKDKYSKNTLYKIGYIVANLDTMATALDKLRNRIFKNTWDTTRLEKILKKLKLSKKLVKNVVEYLNKYAERPLNFVN